MSQKGGLLPRLRPAFVYAALEQVLDLFPAEPAGSREDGEVIEA
jgi:hypothetical protein